MNRGSRGNAHAFKPDSLLKLADTKSAKNRDFTLLHFIVQTIDEKVCGAVHDIAPQQTLQETYREARLIHTELEPVSLAARVQLCL